MNRNKGFDFDLNELNIAEMFNQIGKALETKSIRNLMSAKFGIVFGPT